MKFLNRRIRECLIITFLYCLFVVCLWKLLFIFTTPIQRFQCSPRFLMVVINRSSIRRECIQYSSYFLTYHRARRMNAITNTAKDNLAATHHFKHVIIISTMHRMQEDKDYRSPHVRHKNKESSFLAVLYSYI